MLVTETTITNHVDLMSNGLKLEQINNNLELMEQTIFTWLLQKSL